jgi:hypothetical protein
MQQYNHISPATVSKMNFTSPVFKKTLHECSFLTKLIVF